MFSSWEDIAAKVRAKVDGASPNRWTEGELHELHQLQVLTEEVGELNAAHRDNCGRSRTTKTIDEHDAAIGNEIADVAISLVVFAELFYEGGGYDKIEELVAAKLGRIEDRGGL